MYVKGKAVFQNDYAARRFYDTLWYNQRVSEVTLAIQEAPSGNLCYVVHWGTNV